MHLVVLSPHRDDAAFSCGLLLTHLLRVGATVELVNVCTETDYAPYLSGNSEPRTAQVSRTRRAEDLHFLQSLREATSSGRTTMTDLDWRDSPLRLGIATDNVLQAPAETEATVAALAQAFAPWRQADVILSPLALGNHIDHRMVRDAASLAFSPQQLGWYEDLPYACWMPAAERTQTVQDTLRCLSAQTSAWTAPYQSGDLALKQRYTLCYPSQIAADLAERIAQDAADQRGERMHLPPTVTAKLDATLAAARSPLAQ